MVAPFRALRTLTVASLSFLHVLRVGVFAARYLKPQATASIAVRILSVHCERPKFADPRLEKIVPNWVAVPWIKLSIDGQPLVFFGEEILATSMLRVAHTGPKVANIKMVLYDGQTSLGKARLTVRDDDERTGIPGGWHKISVKFLDGYSSVSFEVQFEAAQTDEDRDELDQIENDYEFWENFLQYSDEDKDAVFNISSLTDEERQRQIQNSQKMASGNRSDMGFYRHSTQKRVHDANVEELRRLLNISPEKLRMQAQQAVGSSQSAVATTGRGRGGRGRGGRGAGRGPRDESGPTLKDTCELLQRYAPDPEHSSLWYQQNHDLRLYFVCQGDIMLICFFKCSAVELQFCRQLKESGTRFGGGSSKFFEIPVENFLVVTTIHGTMKVEGGKLDTLLTSNQSNAGEVYITDRPPAATGSKKVVRKYVVAKREPGKCSVTNPIRDMQARDGQVLNNRKVFAGKVAGNTQVVSGPRRKSSVSHPSTPLESSRSKVSDLSGGVVASDELEGDESLDVDFSDFPWDD